MSKLDTAIKKCTCTECGKYVMIRDAGDDTDLTPLRGWAAKGNLLWCPSHHPKDPDLVIGDLEHSH